MTHHGRVRAVVFLAATFLLAAGAASQERSMRDEARSVSLRPDYVPEPEVELGYTAQALSVADVRSLLGRKIGEVDDLVIGANGHLQRIVVAVDESLLPSGARRLAVQWHDVRVGPRIEDAIAYVQVPVTSDRVARYGVFGERIGISDKDGEWSANELLGDSISLRNGRYGSVNDLVFDRDGRLRAIAARPDIDSPLLDYYAPREGQYAGWRPGGRYYVVPYSARELANILP